MRKTFFDELVSYCASVLVSIFLSNSGSNKLLPAGHNGFNMNLFINSYTKAVIETCSIEPDSSSGTREWLEEVMPVFLTYLQPFDKCIPTVFKMTTFQGCNRTILEGKLYHSNTAFTAEIYGRCWAKWINNNFHTQIMYHVSLKNVIWVQMSSWTL